MGTNISPLAGQPAKAPQLVDVAKLVAAYYSLRPDPAVPAQRVSFGTSGHRGTSFDGSFNEWHVLAITQAICLYRQAQGIGGPLFIGIDTHALSEPAFESALEVLAANGVETLIAKGGEYTPTPAVSYAILAYNRGRETGLADGIVVTPSHNPPDNGGFKYNPPNGGPADTDATAWIEAKANALLEGSLKDVRRIAFDRARRVATTREHDFLRAYVGDLGSVIDFDAIRGSGIRMGVDPMGGAGVHYWARIAERYKLDLTVISEEVDPTFAFMTLDWDGRIRMDPSSAYAMQRLIGLKDGYDIAFACDTDHDRHGIVTPRESLMPSNHYLAVAIDYLFQNRVDWNRKAAVGKTVVSSAMIDRVEAPATPEQKQKLNKLSPQQIQIAELAGEPIVKVLDRAPGNDAPIGGIKVIAASGWFAARSSGTEDIYKIYAESFRGEDHLRILVQEAQVIVDRALQER